MSGMNLRLGLGLGAQRKAGSTWTPANLTGGVLFIDCKSALNTITNSRYSYIADLSGNAAHIIPPSESARPTIEAVTGGFVCDGTQFLPFAKNVNVVTIILAYKPVNTSNTLSTMLFSGTNYYGKIQGSAGGGNGIALQSGVDQYLSTAAIVANGVKAVVSMRQRTTPNGVIRINGVPQVLVATGNSNIVISPASIFTHEPAAQYSVKGVLYGAYINSGALSDADIALVEAWMTARYL